MFAFEAYEYKRLEVFSANGKRINSLAWGKGWGSIDRWLGNQDILIIMSE